MKSLIISLLIILLCSCNSQIDKRVMFLNLEKTKTLTMERPLLIKSFATEYPIEMMEHDSIIYIISAKSDTVLYSINLIDNILQPLSTLGLGPDEWFSPCFVQNSFEYEDIICYDLELLRYTSLSTSNRVAFKKIPSSIGHADQLNISYPLWIYRPIQTNLKHTMAIYNEDTNTTIFNKELFPDIDYGAADINYISSGRICYNKDMNIILEGMYFFDVIKLYNTNGELLKILTFSPEVNFQKDFNRIAKNGEFSGYGKIYATPNYCFLHKKTGSFNNRPSQNMSIIIKLDWSGKYVESYKMPENFTGCFCIDKSENNLYALLNESADNNEEYSLVKFKLGL